MIGDERALIDTIRKRQRKWLRHRLRGVLTAKNGIPMKNGWTENKKQLIVSVILHKYLLYFILRISYLFFISLFY